MLHFLPGPILGALTLVLISLNTVVWSIPIYIGVVFKLLIPIAAGRRWLQRRLIRCAEIWIIWNNAILRLTQKTVWDLRGMDDLNLERRYLVNSNHQSWSDVLVLQRAFSGRIPFLKFFIKQELIWVPLLGLAWWGLDFPFMKRYSREFLEKHPEMRGKDLETTRTLCKRIEGMPVSVMNFLEGTRFTPEKRAAQDSPYTHLLRPKAGGVAFVISAMGETLDGMVDVTVVYVGQGRRLWDFVCGRIERIVVHANLRPIPQDILAGDYENDQAAKQRMQDWVSELWAEKDALIEEISSEFTAPASRAA
jgi:1-acyl-sn-glycerol-3-phosphate acyltransferase